MASEHKTVKTGGTRRQSDTWDRIRFSVLILVILIVIFWTSYNAPFTSAGDAVRDLVSRYWWLLLALGLEVLRQLHYWRSERSAGYNQFWVHRLFGGFERAGARRIKPWTRFRIGRYMRILVYLLIFGLILDYFVADVSSPFEALAEAPQILVRNLSQFVFFLFYPLLLISQFALLFWFLSRGGVEVVLPEEINTRYEDVWGQDHVVELVKENMGFLEKPDEIEEKGGYVPGGILLWGPPGTGKTLIAEATAGEVGVPFVFIEPGSFINMFMGVGILKVKGLFRKLRKLSLRHGGVVAFYDEADSLGSRGALSQQPGPFQPMADNYLTNAVCNGFHYLTDISQENVVAQLPNEMENTSEGAPPRNLVDRIMMGGMGGGGGGMGTLQALLTELSGLNKPRGITNRLRKAIGMKAKPPPKYRIFTMMASNMPNSLDEALLRPGRLDRIYKVGYPSKDGRIATLGGYLEKVQHELTPQQVEDLAVKTPYYSGAKIKDLVNEALVLAIRDDREVVTWEDIWQAKTLKELGPAEDAGYIAREQHAIAIHEACHAVVGHLMKAHMAIDMATIVRRSNTLGMVKSIQIEDRFTQWRTEYEADIMTSLASLAGEKMFFADDNSSGVSADLRNATTLASYMVGVFGMDESIVSLAALSQGRFGTPDPSPDILKTMPTDVEELLQRMYDKTVEVLEQNKDLVLKVAAALEEKKTISGSEIEEIIGTPPGSLAEHHSPGWTSAHPPSAQLSLGAAPSTGEGAASEVDGDGQSTGRDGESGSPNGEPANAPSLDDVTGEELDPG